MRTSLALLAMVTSVPAYAQDIALPDMVVTATRVPTPAANIPAGVTVIDRQTIESHAYNTLTEALNDVPGLHVSASGGPGGQASLFVRGTNSNHVLVLRDGMPINDASDPGGAFNFGVDTLSDIDRIEVIRGPMAALYGSGAIGGVINLISKRGTEPGPHLMVDLSGGYPAQIRGAIQATGTQGPIDYALTMESQSQRGFDSNPQRMTAYTGLPQGFRDRIATLNLGYTPIDGTRISLFLRARQALFSFNTLGTPTYDTANSQGSVDSLLGRIGVQSTLFDGRWETGLFIGHQQDDRRYVEPLIATDPNLNTMDNRYHAYRTDAQWNNTLHATETTSLTFGYEHIVDDIKVRTSSTSFGFPFAQTAAARSIGDAAYAGAQTTLWNRLTLTGQIRQDWVAAQAPFTWRVGAVLEAPEIDTSFKIAYGTAFRAPSLFDRFGVDSFGFMGNPNLKSETAQGWEIGFTTTLPAFGQSDFVTFGTTYFNEQVNNLIVGVFAPVDTETNIGSAHLQGFETAFALHPAKWLTLRLTHTYTDAQNADTSTNLLRRPQNAGTLDATIMPLPGLKIVPSLTYTGAFGDVIYDNGGTFLGSGTSRQGLIANLTVTYDVTPKMKVYAATTNLFGSRFESVNSYQVPGTAAIAGIRLKLE
jgi:vitamin B12 transporter